MLQLELNGTDLANIRLSGPWGPLAESLFSLVQLQRRQQGVLLDGWRQRARHQLPDRARPLLALMRPSGIVDLHTLIGQAPTVDHALDALHGVRSEHLRAELTEVLRLRPGDEAPWVRAWLRHLADGAPEARRQLGILLRDYHEQAVAPYWEGMRSHIESDRAYRSRVMADGGVDQLLSTLHPSIRWRPPILEIDRIGCAAAATAGTEPVRHRLDGRSLVLVPSAFCLDRSVVLRSTTDEAAPSLLFYPTLGTVSDAAAMWAPATPPRQALGMLLGETRAAAIDAIAAAPSTTTELARRIGVTPATASHHVGILRETGLVATRRMGNAVLHTITPLGAALLDGRHTPP